MATPLDAIVGPLGEKDRLQMLANQLSRQQTLGLMGAASGDIAMGNAGRAAYVGATDIGNKTADNYYGDQYRQYQQDLGAQQHLDKLAQMNQNERIQAEHDASRERAAALRAAAAAVKKGKLISPTDRNRMDEATSQLGGLETLLNYDEAAQKKGVSVGNFAGIPGSRLGINFLGSHAGDLGKRLLPENANMSAGREYWSGLQSFYALGKKHSLFGSAFTKTEAEQWDQAAISPGMTDEDRLKATRTMVRIARAKYAQMKENLDYTYGEGTTSGYNPEDYHVPMESMDALLSGQVVTQGSQTGGGPSVITRRPMSAPAGGAVSSPISNSPPQARAPGMLPRYKVTGPPGQEQFIPMNQ